MHISTVHTDVDFLANICMKGKCNQLKHIAFTTCNRIGKLLTNNNDALVNVLRSK